MTIADFKPFGFIAPKHLLDYLAFHTIWSVLDEPEMPNKYVYVVINIADMMTISVFMSSWIMFCYYTQLLLI